MTVIWWLFFCCWAVRWKWREWDEMLRCDRVIRVQGRVPADDGLLAPEKSGVSPFCYLQLLYLHRLQHALYFSPRPGQVDWYVPMSIAVFPGGFICSLSVSLNSIVWHNWSVLHVITGTLICLVTVLFVSIIHWISLKQQDFLKLISRFTLFKKIINTTAPVFFFLILFLKNLKFVSRL